MPRNRGIRGEQWETCQRCGREYPISQLGYQEGYLICYRRCWDAKTVAQGDAEQAHILDLVAQDSLEGADTRYDDLALWRDDLG